MTHTSTSKQVLLLTATGPLLACVTSVFTALIVVAVLLVCTLCTSAVVKLIVRSKNDKPEGSNIALVIATATSAIIIVAALLLALVTLGFSDIVAAFSPQMTLAAFAAAILGCNEKPLPTAARSGALIIAVGVVCELIGRGSLLGDYELAFAGATHEWLLRAGLPPISFLATPAGALLMAALITALPLRRRKAMRNDVPAITEPRSGRRVRVTGHIS